MLSREKEFVLAYTIEDPAEERYAQTSIIKKKYLRCTHYYYIMYVSNRIVSYYIVLHCVVSLSQQ